MKVTTTSGFACEIKDNAFDDYRVIKLISEIESAREGKVENSAALVATINLFSRLLGDEQEEALIEHLEAQSEDGIATLTAMYADVGSIMTALQESKKNT